MLDSALSSLEQTSIASLQNQISQLQSSIEFLQSTQTQLSDYVSTLQDQVRSMEGNYSGLNALIQGLQAQSDQFSKDIASLSESIENNSKDLKKWVEESYATLEAFNALEHQVSEISASISGIISRLDTLDEKTKKIADDLEAATDAVTKSLGKCQEDIEAIQDALKKLQEDMDEVKAQISALVSAVQSVVVVPDYNDGSVRLSGCAGNSIRFEVYPLSAAEKLASIGASALSLDYVETQTKSDFFTSIPVSSVSFDDGILTVIADGTGLREDFRKGNFNARLRISDGTVTRSSEFFPITYRIVDLLPPGEITGLYAVLNARTDLFDSEGTDNLVYGFVYSETQGRTNIDYTRRYQITAEADSVQTYTINSEGRFSAIADHYNNNSWEGDIPIKNNTTYYYRAFVKENGRYYYSDESMFTTPDIDVTYDDTNVSPGAYSATVNGKLVTNCTYKQKVFAGYLTVVYGVYSNVEDLNDYGHHAWAYINEDGSFSVLLEGLKPDTKYFFFVEKIYSHKNDGSPDIMVRSAIQSFTTVSPVIIIDGDFSDWDNVSCSQAIVEDGSNLLKIKALVEDANLFVYFEYRIDSNQGKARLGMYINSDGDEKTGGLIDDWKGLDYCLESANGFLKGGLYQSMTDASVFKRDGADGCGWWDYSDLYDMGICDLNDKGVVQDGVVYAEFRLPLRNINATSSQSLGVGIYVMDNGWNWTGWLPSPGNGLLMVSRPAN